MSLPGSMLLDASYAAEPETARALRAEMEPRLETYGRGLNNYQYAGSILRIEPQHQISQIDLEMILVIT